MLNTIRFFCSLFSPLYILACCPCATDPVGYIYEEHPPFYYPPSIHTLAGISVARDSVELEDGSVWKISPYDGQKALNWLTSDPLTITQNPRWFSSYNYQIVNQNTGTSLEANLFLGPIEHGIHTLYVTGIDRDAGDLVISNGYDKILCFQISSSDHYIFQSWALHDAIIVGSNHGWDSFCEILLINVNMNNCVRARIPSELRP